MIDTSVSKGLVRVRKAKIKEGFRRGGFFRRGFFFSTLKKARRNRDPWTVALSSFSALI